MSKAALPSMLAQREMVDYLLSKVMPVLDVVSR